MFNTGSQQDTTGAPEKGGPSDLSEDDLYLIEMGLIELGNGRGSWDECERAEKLVERLRRAR